MLLPRVVFPELPVSGAQPELPMPAHFPSALLLLFFLLHVLFVVLFLAAGTRDRTATTAARHDGRTRVSTW